MDDFQKFLEQQLEDPDFRKEWNALEPAFTIMKAISEAQEAEQFTEQEFSERSGIPLRELHKLENGNANPSIKTLQKLAAAMGKTLKIEFV